MSNDLKSGFLTGAGLAAGFVLAMGAISFIAYLFGLGPEQKK